ncbi:hypothetical protein VNO77_23057 [Canavalia gladiata]|uniref:Uncharacterized protein n=1 Tax=Canavalia gladiata TaxID=3824 RepID=A0AAN9L3T2_CANGL
MDQGQLLYRCHKSEFKPLTSCSSWLNQDLRLPPAIVIHQKMWLKYAKGNQQFDSRVMKFSTGLCESFKHDALSYTYLTVSGSWMQGKQGSRCLSQTMAWPANGSATLLSTCCSIFLYNLNFAPLAGFSVYILTLNSCSNSHVSTDPILDIKETSVTTYQFHFHISLQFMSLRTSTSVQSQIFLVLVPNCSKRGFGVEQGPTLMKYYLNVFPKPFPSSPIRIPVLGFKIHLANLLPIRLGLKNGLPYGYLKTLNNLTADLTHVFKLRPETGLDLGTVLLILVGVPAVKHSILANITAMNRISVRLFQFAPPLIWGFPKLNHFIYPYGLRPDAALCSHIQDLQQGPLQQNIPDVKICTRFNKEVPTFPFSNRALIPSFNSGSSVESNPCRSQRGHQRTGEAISRRNWDPTTTYLNLWPDIAPYSQVGFKFASGSDKRFECCDDLQDFIVLEATGATAKDPRSNDPSTHARLFIHQLEQRDVESDVADDQTDKFGTLLGCSACSLLTSRIDDEPMPYFMCRGGYLARTWAMARGDSQAIITSACRLEWTYELIARPWIEPCKQGILTTCSLILNSDMAVFFALSSRQNPSPKTLKERMMRKGNRISMGALHQHYIKIKIATNKVIVSPSESQGSSPKMKQKDAEVPRSFRKASPRTLKISARRSQKEKRKRESPFQWG